ncbi:hypothetical protein F4225_03160 [Candidatus Poribacteria bacterium]|nr:hypothetical protein [Candidatus Poribacteria bacterium]
MKPAALVYINRYEKKELDRLLHAIEDKRKQVEDLTVTVEQLKKEVDLFQHKYNSHVGRFYLELDQIDLEAQEYRLRLKLQQENISAEEIERRVEACFKENRARFNTVDNEKESKKKNKKKQLPDEEANYVKNLYRKLAKRFHPDKAEHPDEQNRHEQLMPLINKAYEDQDLLILERLNIGETDFKETTEQTHKEKREQLHKNLRNLNRIMSELRSEINRVKAGRTYQLKQQVENAEKNGNDLLSTLAADLKRRVKSSKKQLTNLINIWKLKKPKS